MRSTLKEIEFDKFINTYHIIKNYLNSNTGIKNNIIDISKLNDAIKNRKRVSFIYQNKLRKVYPMGIKLFNNSWYLGAEDNNKLKTFSLNKWFMSYMGIFFIIFSFLKLLNVSGFSMTFKKYDLISKIIPGYANSYPFIELALGIIFLTQTQSILIYANTLTLIFMISQTIGIIR